MPSPPPRPAPTPPSFPPPPFQSFSHLLQLAPFSLRALEAALEPGPLPKRAPYSLDPPAKWLDAQRKIKVVEKEPNQVGDQGGQPGGERKAGGGGRGDVANRVGAWVGQSGGGGDCARAGAAGRDLGGGRGFHVPPSLPAPPRQHPGLVEPAPPALPSPPL